MTSCGMQKIGFIMIFMENNSILFKSIKKKSYMNLTERITINPELMAGKPVIRGLRISVDQIIKSLASGLSNEEILEDYPELESEDIKAALFYASKILESEKIYRISA
jgi:uncharacterized protein (DUF433 family)